MKQLVKYALAFGVLLSSLAWVATPALAQSNSDDYYTTYDSTYDNTLSNGAAAGIFGVTFIIPLCCGLLIAGGIAYFVYSDAKKNNVENPVLWAVITFFTGLIGLLIYFLAIRPKATEGTPAKK